ncbi:MAG: hypothetical protein GY720_10250, partial [bacterium]|nr:hypothetical protein [bacterium]
MFSFAVDPAYLNEAITGPSDNVVHLETTHLNGGHFMVATEMMLVTCLDQFVDWVVAADQAEADQIVAQRSYLLPAPNELGVGILQPGDGDAVAVGSEVRVTAWITDDVGREWSHVVFLDSGNGNGNVILHDDGFHGDGGVRDGTYSNIWTPLNDGSTTLTVSSSCCTIAGSDQITVEVYHSDHVVDVSHYVPITATTALTGAATPSLLHVLPAAGELEVGWQYVLDVGKREQVVALPVALPDVQPGEVRQVASSTVLSYTGPGGSGQVSLGPLYVAAPHLVAVTPSTQTASLGSRAVYEISLFNPDSNADIYSVTVAGLPGGWAISSFTTSLASGEQATFPLTVTVPEDGEPGAYSFAVVAENSFGGRDQAQARLQVTTALVQVRVAPKWGIAGNGDTLTYTVAVTNAGTVSRTYTLSTEGLAGNAISLAAMVEVSAGQGLTVPLLVTVGTDRGPHAFEVRAEYTAASQAIGASDDGVLVVLNDLSAVGALSPTIVTGGQTSPAAYTLVVTNTGSLSDTYDVTLELPPGWSYELSANGHVQNHLSLTPYVFNSANLQLLVTPSDGTPEGDYLITATVTSRVNPSVQATVSGTTHVSRYGVTVEITPDSTTMDPPGSEVWDVTVTNTGEDADVFDLMAGGIVSSTAQFSLNPVSLAAGSSTVVQLAAQDLNFGLPQTYFFAVTARSQAEPDVLGYDTASVTFLGFEDVTVEITPTLVTLTNTNTAYYLLLVTNSGN